MYTKFQLVVSDKSEMQFVKTFETYDEAINYYRENLKEKYPNTDYQIYIRKQQRGWFSDNRRST